MLWFGKFLGYRFQAVDQNDVDPAFLSAEKIEYERDVLFALISI